MQVAFASLAVLGMVGCAVEEELDVGAASSAITVTSATPVLQLSPTLPEPQAYADLPTGFRFVSRGCHFEAFVTYSVGVGEFMTTGVCTRPRAVLWRVYGSNRVDYPRLSRRIAAQVASVTAEIEDEAATSGAVIDFGTGGGGDFTKIGPRGGGPVGPGPGGPGGVIEYLFDAASEVEALHVAATPVVELPGLGGYQPSAP
jgi:hypothetical protein